MNRVYRLVFNRALRVWQVASELVRAPGGSTGASAPRAHHATIAPLRLAMLCALGLVSLVDAAQAQSAGRIVGDPAAPGNERPTVMTAPNGVPLVNITTPSAAGVSRNRYSQFDVGREGAILNNARSQAQTQLGGWVQGNPWLATGSARVILNEVNGPASRLNGYVEVAGQRAEVIIANPAGIQVDGGGFLNASRVTLTTGTPILSNGALDGYRVNGGAIQVAGAGLDTSGADYTDLITRSLQVNAGIWANQLQASLGNNIVSADQARVAPQAASGPAPTFALDVGALGGMFANKIWLVGNENGVGVRNAGNIGARAGELVVTVDGRLENTGTLQSQQDTRVAATGGIANAGTLSATRELRVTTAADLDNRGGTLNAQRLQIDASSARNQGGSIEQTGLQALGVTAGNVTNRAAGRLGAVAAVPTSGATPPGSGGNTGNGTPDNNDRNGGSSTVTPPSSGQAPGVAPLAAGALTIAGLLDNDGGRINAGGDVTLSAANGLDNSDGRLGVSALSARGDLLNRAGTLAVYGEADLQLGALVNDAGRLSVANALRLETQSLSNRSGEVRHSGVGTLAMQVRGLLDNTQGVLASNAAALQLNAQTVVNAAGRIEHAGTQGLTLAAQDWSGAGGSIATLGALTWRAGTVDHRNAAVSATQLTLQADTFDNRGGALLSTGPQAATLQVAGRLDNGDNGSIASNGDLTLRAGTFGNAGGQMQQAGTGLLSIAADALEGRGGRLVSNGGLTVTGGNIDLAAGSTSAQQIRIDANALSTAGGSLVSQGNQALQLSVRDHLDNRAGSLASNAGVTIDAGSFGNQGGSVLAAGRQAASVTVGGTLDNSAGTISGNAAVLLQAGSLLNRGGNVLAANGAALQVRAATLLDNSQGGRLATSGDLNVSASTLDNRAGAIEHAGSGTLTVTADALQGAGGKLLSLGNVQLRGGVLDLGPGSTTQAQGIDISADRLRTAGGLLSATGNDVMNLHVTGALDNDGGTIAGNGALALQTGALSNRAGTLSAAGTADSRVDVIGQLDNSGGRIASNGATLHVGADHLINQQGTLSHSGTQGMDIVAGRVDGSKGTIASSGALSLTATDVDHREATIGADRVDVQVQTLDNRGGRIVASGNGASSVQASALNNAGGTLAGNGDLSLRSTLLDNTLGTIQHAGIGQLQIAAQTLAGTGGKIISNGTLRVTGQNTDLTNASTSARTIMVATGNFTTAGGQLSASGDQLLKLDVSGTLNNSSGTIGGNGVLALNAQNVINTQGTVQAAGSGQSSLTMAQALQNQQGKILLGGDGRITAASVDNRAGTLHAAGGVLQLDVDGVLDNRTQGVVSSAGKLELEAGTLDNTAGTIVAGTDLTVVTDTAIGNNNGAIQATNALQLLGAGLSNRSGNIIGGNVVVDTRAQQLDNTSGTIGSQAGTLDVRSGALTNAGGRLQSKAALLLQTNGQSITNTGSGANGGILAGGGLQVDGGALDNRGGAVFAQGDARVAVSSVDNSGAGVLSAAGDLALTAAALNNAGGRVQGSQAVNLTLAGALDNQAGLVAAGGLLTLNASSVDNRNTRTSANPLGLQAGQLQLQTQALDNRQGQVITDGAGNLQVTTSLDNTGGQISSGGSLDMRADAVANTAGLLRSDGNQRLTAGNLSGDGQVQSQSNLTLTLRDGLTNTGEMIANGTLAIHTDGDIANQGVLRAGNIDLAARNVDNAVNGQITSQGVTHIATGGQLVNRGLIDGGLTHLQAATLDNVGTGRIYGDHVAIAAGNLLNRAETIAGVTRVATVAARNRLDLGVGQLSNTDRGLIYSDGDAAIGGTLDGNRLATGIARQIDNLGSTIEVAGDLDLHATTINNIRQNVVVTQTTTTLAPVRLDQPSWRNNGPNGRSDIRITSHYSASEIYYLDPADILEDSPYITPDGYHVGRAVIRVTPQTSAYFFERGALYSATGQRSRLDPQSGTLTIYYIGRQDNQANPDQVSVGADDPFVEVSQLHPGSPAFHYASDTLHYSNAYGTCTTNCVQLWAQWAYTDPDHILLNPQGTGGGELGDNERYRMATRTIVEDVLQPGAGPEAVIHAGGALRIGTDALHNTYARIAAGGDLGITGLTHDADVTNLAYTLYRTHSFNNLTTAYNGTTRSWSNPSISEQIGQVGGALTSGGTLTIDVGNLSNLNQGRDAPNVQAGAAVANLNIRGAQAAPTGPGRGSVGGAANVSVDAAGRIIATVTQAANGNVGGAVNNVANNGPVNGARGVTAAGGSPDRIVMGTPDTRAPTGSLFTLRPTSSHYLVETDPQFADYRSWLGSDYLLNQMGYSADTLQKRLGDGYYEQKLVREQIGQLTGRRFLEGYKSDEAQYQALLDAGATIGKAWNLRPGVALTDAQMAQLTSDIVWLVEQTVTLPDGSTTTALVPQVYLRLRPGDLEAGGALLAGANVDVTLAGGLKNTGTIAGRQLVSIDAGRIEHLGGSISGDQVGLRSASDIRIEGASVTAVDALSVQAAGDVTVASTVETLQGGGFHQYSTTQIQRVAGLYVTGTHGNGVLSVVAGHDVNLQAAQIRNAGTDGVTQLVAGNNLNVGTQTLSHSTDTTANARNFQRSSDITHLGTTVQGAGSVVLAAGNDLTLTAAQVGAGKSLALQAGRDINSQAAVDSSTSASSTVTKSNSLATSSYDESVRGTQLGAGDTIVMQAGRDLTLASTAVASQTGGIAVAAGHDIKLLATQEQHDAVVDQQTRKKSTFSSQKTTTHDEWHDSLAIGSSLSGKTVNVVAGNDLAVVGSTVRADGNVRVAAGNNIIIESAQDTSSEAHSVRQKKSGLTGSSGGGVASVGYAKSSSDSQESTRTVTQVASSVGSTDGNLVVSAGNQLTIAGSDLGAGKDLTVAAKDIALLARQDTVDHQSSQSSKSSGFSVGVTYDSGASYRSARDSTTRNMVDTGSTMSKISRNAEGAAAGTMAAITPVVIQASSHRSNASQTDSKSDARVSQLAAGGNLTLLASDGSITSQGTQMSAEGNAVLLASKDIVFDIAHNTQSSGNASTGKGWGFNNAAGLPYGNYNQQGTGTGKTDTITGTQLSVGGNASLSTTQGDISLTASNIAAQGNVSMRAAGDLTIQSGQDLLGNANQSTSKGIGTVVISDTERFAGYNKKNHTDDNAQISQVASNVGSLGGNVSLTAGGTYTQSASNVVAAKDIDITAASIQLLTANTSSSASQQDDDLKIGAFARIKSPLIDLINNVDDARKSDGRLGAMQGMAAAANAYQSASAISSMAGGAGSGSLLSVEAGVGFSTNESSFNSSSQISQGSTITGGGNVRLKTTEGDLHIVQGNIKAGETLSLDAARDLVLEAGNSSNTEQSKGSNAGFEVGVGASVGAQTGVYAYVQASAGSHKSNVDGSTWQNTQLAGQNIVFKSEGDTTLRGAVVKGDRIDVQASGDLTIESLQDRLDIQSKESSVGGRVQISAGTAWDASGYASGAKANGNYLGVVEQSGLFAGNGGYHVTAGKVNLIGGAIASTNAGASELTADSLTFTDLKNRMDYSASSGSISGGFGSTGTQKTDANGNPVQQSVGEQSRDIGNNIANGNYGKANTASMMPGVPMHESGSDTTYTRATLTEGTIKIGGKTTTAAATGINTDASAAHEAVATLPDVRKILGEQQAMAAAIGTVVQTGVSIRNDINASIDEAQRQKKEAKAVLEDPVLSASLTPEQKVQLAIIAVEADKETARLQKVGVLVSSITGGISVASGSTGQILAGTLAPVASYQIGQYFKENATRNDVDGGNRGEEGSASHLLAHSVLGAAIASAGGGSELIGAITAAGAEAAAPALAKFLYGRDSNDLNADEKSTISAVVGLGGAVLGSFTDDLRGAIVGSSIAKNAVDNNWGEVGHYSTMATVLYLAGFSERDAKAIALAAWSPDTDTRNAITVKNIEAGNTAKGDQQNIHLLDGESDRLKVVAKQKELGAQVAEILGEINDLRDNPAAKAVILSSPENQRILHAFGDSFAHVQEDGTHYPGIVGHFSDGVDPDDPAKRPQAYANYVSSLYQIAIERKGGVKQSGGLAELSAAVSAQNTEVAQKAILAAAVELHGGKDPALVNSPLSDCKLYKACSENKANSIINGIYDVWPVGTPVINWLNFPK
ncbi:hemagglutinin repeat-containing protein [Xanthomonas oryzae]|uniref:hemagglutinin repeat-containing protein n=2 Tax=Xanthomonas oryzae TaxID=347 RepID=UPI001F5E8A66|nr:hemagglutinin repeat-containing protein [Xanthomonas oryzae]